MLTITCVATAAEVDSVSTRNIVLKDSLAALDELVNRRIQAGVDEANRRRDNYSRMGSDDFCDEEILYDELRKSIFDSFTASWGLKGFSLDKQLREILHRQSYELPLRESIYRDISLEEGISLNLKALTNVARVDGYLIGFDKIGHFFSEGWQYFNLVHFRESSLDEALHWGTMREQGRYGFTTTGIFSYADLVANFNGYRFWSRVRKAEKDPVSWYKSVLQRPYVRCKLQIVDSIRYRKMVRVWEVDSLFNFSEYIDGVWDEGTNCNSYKTTVIEEKVQKRIEEVAPGFRCPELVQECRLAQKRYGTYSRDILHPSCLNNVTVE